MAEKVAKGGKRRTNPQKRHLQNVRTFNHVQKRRAKHAAAHGLKPEQISARRWVASPISKASGAPLAAKAKK